MLHIIFQASEPSDSEEDFEEFSMYSMVQTQNPCGRYEA